MPKIQIIQTVAPSLPIATSEYQQQYFNQYSNVLRLYFNQIDNFSRALLTPYSGITADRPIQNIAVGQFYFDTDLGYPIWYNGTNWVDSTGGTV
jgi:hypothetical protein